MTAIANMHTQAMKKGSLMALVLHGTIFLSLVGFAVYRPAHKLVDSYVFELVAEPMDGADAPGSAPSLEKTLQPEPIVQLVKAPEVAQAVSVPTIEIPEPVVEQDLAEESSAEPQSVAAAVKQTPQKNKVEANSKNAAKPNEKAQKISYKDFVKKQGKPKPTTKAAKPALAKEVKIDTEGAKIALAKALGGKGSGSGAANGSTSGTAVDGALVDSFNTALLRKIDAAWVRPNTIIAQWMSVVVEFEVAARGKIGNVRIVQGSGNEEIDQSVREAFIKVGNAGKPPHYEGGVYRLRFRVE